MKKKKELKDEFELDIEFEVDKNNRVDMNQVIELVIAYNKLFRTYKQLKENIDKLELENKVLKEQMVAIVRPNYTYGVRGSNE